MSFSCRPDARQGAQDGSKDHLALSAVRPTVWLWRSAIYLMLGSFTIVIFNALQPISSALAQSAEPAVVAPATPSPRPAIAVTSATDAVARFKAETQLYIKGEPLPPDQVERLQTLLQQHPNIYVVLIDNSTNVVADDMTLSTGIGNSAAFQSVQNSELGEPEGVLFMIYFDSDQGRKIFMRAEALPDRLNVGEANFADASGNPRELLRLFVDAVQGEGKDVPGALEIVINRINGTIQQHVQSTIQDATQAVQGADTALASFAERFSAFQAQYAVTGPLARPDLAMWGQQHNNAKTALENRQFEDARAMVTSLLEQVQIHQQAMDAYEQTPTIAQTVTQTLSSIRTDLSTLKENNHTQAATELAAQAQQALDTYQAQYQAGSLDFSTPLETAQQQAEQALEQIAASRELSVNRQNIGYAMIALGGLAGGTTGGFSNRRAKRRRQQAALALAAAKAEIADKTKALIALMDKADYTVLANYEGTTDQMAKQLVARVTDALTLVGGAEKFTTEAEGLIGGYRLTNTFRTVNFDRAIALLSDSETQLTFGFEDSVRAAMTQGSTAESWRQTLLNQETSRQFAKSFRDVLLAMADNRDAAMALLEEITFKDQNIADHLAEVEAKAQALAPEVQVLHQQGEADQVFQLQAVADQLLSAVLADLDKGGLIARGRAIMGADPVKSWDEFGDLAQRITEDGAAIVAAAQWARANLVPTVNQAHQTLAPHGVKTEWASQRQQQLSEALDEITRLAIRIAIAERLQQTQAAIAELDARIQCVMQQDQERRQVCPNLIATAQQDVATARQEIHDALKQAGVFRQGTVQQVLREPEQDPSDKIKLAQTNLDQIKPCLSEGDAETAATHLTQVKILTQAAHDLVTSTRAALQIYPATLQERQQRTNTIETSIAPIYQPILRRIQTTYVEDVWQCVAPEVKSGQTIADNIDLANNLLVKAQTLTQAAQTNYQQAYLLTAKTNLEEIDRILQGAQYQLDALVLAEERLTQHQQQAEADLETLTQALRRLQTSAQAAYVRPTALTLVDKTVQTGSEAQAQVHQKPYHPYLSHEYLSQAETLRLEAMAAIAADQQAYELALTELNAADQAISTASSDIQRARSTHFQYATVRTGAAAQHLSTAQHQQQQAKILKRDRDYEAASRLAKQAIATAHQASHAVDEAIRRARRESEAEARRREEERRRAASSSSSGSSGGDWDGGSSGSSGGSW